MGSSLPSLLRPFAERPGAAGVFTDFDGTLAPIVESPDAAVPLPGVVPALEALADRLGRVAVVSGRPVSFLERFVPSPSAVVLSGLYGLESVVRGERSDDPLSGVWREAVADVAGAGVKGPAGMLVENKGLSVTLHFREHPEAAERRSSVGGRAGPPVGAGGARGEDVVGAAPAGRRPTRARGRASGGRAWTSVAFFGDDVGDLPAFAALDRLAAAGRPTWPASSCAPRRCRPSWSAGRSGGRRAGPGARPPPTPRSALSPDLVADRTSAGGARAGRPASRPGCAGARPAGGARAARRRAARARHRGRRPGRRRCRRCRRGARRRATPASSVPDARPPVTAASTASRSFTSAPSLATRFRPSRIGLTSSTSARRRAATERGKSSAGSSTMGVQPGVRPAVVDSATVRLDVLRGRRGSRPALRATGRRRRRTPPARRHSG